MRLPRVAVLVSLVTFATDAASLTPWDSNPLVECPFHSQETLEGCTGAFQWNSEEACGPRTSWLATFVQDWLSLRMGWNRVTLDNLSRLHWLAGHSFTHDFLTFLEQEDGSSAWPQAFAHWLKTSWKSLAVYALAGVVPTVIGAVLLAVLILVIVPLLIMGLFTRLKLSRWRRPKPLKNVVLHFTLQALLAVVVVACVIIALQSVNATYYAVEDAQCGVFKVSQDFLVDGFRTNGERFAGVASGLVGLRQAERTVSDLGLELQGPISLREKTAVGLKSLFAPVVWTDALLRSPNYFMGWGDVTGLRGVAFSLNMTVLGAREFADAAAFESDTGDYGALLAAASMTGSAGTTDPPPETRAAVSVAAQAVSDVHGASETVLPSLSEFYSRLVQVVNALADWWTWHFRTTYWLLMLFSSLPLIGILLAASVALCWKTRDDVVRRNNISLPSRYLRAWSGFVIFALLFWGSILFLVGGAVLAASYFTSDACHFVQEDLFSQGRYAEYQPFESIPPKIIDACLTDSSNGNLLEQFGNFSIDSLSTFMTQTEVIDVSLIGSASISHTGATNFVSASGVPNLVVPLDYNSLPETDDRIRWSSLAQDRVTTLPASLLAAAEAVRPVSPLPIYGLSDVTDALNTYLRTMGCSHHFLCLGTGCPAEAILVTPQSVYRYDLTALRLALESQNWVSVVSNLAASYAMKEVATCVANSVLATAETKTQFFGGLWIAAHKATAMSNLLRVPGGLTDHTVVDLCPITQACPLFFHTSLANGDTPDITLVSYKSWEDRIGTDVAETLSISSASSLAALVTNSAVGYNSATMAAKGLELLTQSFNCHAILSQLEGVHSAVCNGPFADVAAWGVTVVIVAAMHVLGALFIWMFWRTQKLLEQPRLPAVSAASPEDSPPSHAADFQATNVNLPEVLTTDEFFYAAEMGLNSSVARCIQHFEPNTVEDLYKNTPLHLTAYYGHEECSAMLLNAGWHVDSVNFKGNTPLLAAVCSLSLETASKAKVIRLLLSFGANPNHINSDGETPLSALGKTSEFERLSPVLLAHGATQ